MKWNSRTWHVYDYSINNFIQLELLIGSVVMLVRTAENLRLRGFYNIKIKWKYQEEICKHDGQDGIWVEYLKKSLFISMPICLIKLMV